MNSWNLLKSIKKTFFLHKHLRPLYSASQGGLVGLLTVTVYGSRFEYSGFHGQLESMNDALNFSVFSASFPPDTDRQVQSIMLEDINALSLI